MRTRTKIISLGIVAFTMMGVAGPVAASSGHSAVPLDKIVPALSTEQQEQDVVPADVNLRDLGNVIPESTRLLGSDHLANYWVGRAGDTQVCLVVQIPGGMEVSASTCTDIPTFYQTGLGIIAGEGSDSRTVEAYLLPADVPTADLPVSGVPAAEQSHFIAGPVNEVVAADAEIRRADGSTFIFRTLSTSRK